MAPSVKVSLTWSSLRSLKVAWKAKVLKVVSPYPSPTLDQSTVAVFTSNTTLAAITFTLSLIPEKAKKYSPGAGATNTPEVPKAFPILSLIKSNGTTLLTVE